jgi:hypothetical protein
VYRLSAGEVDVFLADSALAFAHALTPPALRERLPPVDRNWIGFLDSAAERFDPKTQGTRQAKGFLAWIDGLPPGNALSVLHTVLPHAPYRHYPSGRVYSESGIEPSGAPGWDFWRGDEWAILQSQQRHLLQLAYVDRLLGSMLDRLEALDVLDSALLVVTADHGVAFRSDARRRHLDEIRAPARFRSCRPRAPTSCRRSSTRSSSTAPGSSMASPC